MNLVFFDFDDTITAIDTTLPFGAFLSRRSRLHPPAKPLLLALILARFGLHSNSGLKKFFCRRFLRGLRTAEVGQMALAFHETCLPSLLDEAVYGALRMHSGRGDAVYLVSANFECLLEPAIDSWCLGGMIATRAEVRDDVYTGAILGEACHGEEKLRRLIARFGRPAIEKAVAYGNQDDAPLLRAVRTAFLVRRARRPGVMERIKDWRRILAGHKGVGRPVAPHLIVPFPRETHSVKLSPEKA